MLPQLGLFRQQTYLLVECDGVAPINAVTLPRPELLAFLLGA